MEIVFLPLLGPYSRSLRKVTCLIWDHPGNKLEIATEQNELGVDIGPSPVFCKVKVVVMEFLGFALGLMKFTGAQTI